MTESKRGAGRRPRRLPPAGQSRRFSHQSAKRKRVDGNIRINPITLNPIRANIRAARPSVASDIFAFLQSFDVEPSGGDEADVGGNGDRETGQADFEHDTKLFGLIARAEPAG